MTLITPLSNIQSLEVQQNKALEEVAKTNEQIQQNTQKEPRRKNLQEAMKDPKHPLASTVNRIIRRRDMASKALDFIKQGIEKEKKYYSAERNDKRIIASDTISVTRYEERRVQSEYGYYYQPNYWTMKDKQNTSKTYLEDYITYATDPHASGAFAIFLKNAEKLAKARNDDERYQPLKDIMDEMIIMLAKASSMFMPPAVVDITIKALEMIGGHLADIIREDFEKIVNKPNNSSELAEWTEKKQGLQKTIDNSIKAAESSQMILSFSLTETAKNLGLPVDSKKQITEEFIINLEKKIEEIQREPKENPPLNLKPEEIKSLITSYRTAQTTFESMKKKQEELNNVNHGVEQPKKGTERQSIKEMIKETKTKRDATFKDTVRKQQEEHQAKFKTR